MGINCYENNDGINEVSLTNEAIECFNKKINKNVCKIIGSNGGIDRGFFCRIPFPNEHNLLPVLITNNTIMNENDISSKNRNIQLIINKNDNKDKEENLEIITNDFRKTYVSDKNKITMIEIKKGDGLDINSFPEMDNQIFNDNLNIEVEIRKNSYETNHEYIIFLLNNEKTENENKLGYLLSDENVLFGFPVINVDNGKVIGINTENNKKLMSLRNSVKEFQQNFEVFNNIYTSKKGKSTSYSNEIKIQYKIGEDKEISIFGKEFVINNKDKCKIMINGKEEKLCQMYNTQNIELKNKDIFEIKLKGIKKVKNMSSMFCFCDTLFSIDFSKFNASEVTDVKNLFCGCESLQSVSDISHWNTIQFIDISGMFSGCSSLLSLPDISKWNTNNIIDISNLFSGCSSLTKIPDISKWNTNNVTNMNNLFSKCSSLLEIPDISNWNTSNVSNMTHLFAECSSLKTISDISNWNMINVMNITRMFYKCSSLVSVPDISKWNTSNIKHMNSLFEDCSSLKTLPDISKWDTSHVTSMYSMFAGCSSLSSLPNISKWDTTCVTDMSKMFYECSSLTVLPDISKWNTRNVTDMRDMFEGCNSSLNIPDKFK